MFDALNETDFGLFVLAPDDVLRIRDSEHLVVRDNVVFELGLFIGRLGRERSFIVAPRNAEEFHLPTDLLGITPATYDSDRQDGNLVAALGPACNRIRRAIEKFGALEPLVFELKTAVEPTNLISDSDDCITLIESWMGQRPRYDNEQAIKYKDVDRNLGLVPGSAEKFIAIAAARWGYQISRNGKETILFKK